MADQIKNPRRTIPIAIVGGVFIAAVVYTMIAGTTLGVLGPRAMGRTDTPLFLAASRAVGGWGAWVIISSG
jgi:APA family basic amino acid/polyamine antiporter